MLLETKIIQYLQEQSRGIICLSATQARHLISLVKFDGDITTGAHVKLFRWNGTNSKYDFLYSVLTTDEDIKQKIIAALEKRPAEKCYVWECYNSNGELEGKIYSINTNLFI